jgi:hypothetical protein
MDCGEPSFQRFVLDEARSHITRVPDSDGIVIDRMDYLRLYNMYSDDGVSWVDGKPLLLSWIDCLRKLGRVMHRADKVIYANTLYRRLDAVQQLDGYYDEFGMFPFAMNLGAMLAINKPYIAWTYAVTDPSPDAYFQRHLYMGSFLTIPFPANDHQILPTTSEIDRRYMDYGPLFDALHGKRWVLQPHVISVEGDTAKANLFAVPGGYVIPITFGGESARIILRGLIRQCGQDGFAAEMIRPGEQDWTPVTCDDTGSQLAVSVPLKHGCAMVRLSYAWMKPNAQWFLNSARIEIGTKVAGADMRYTLDGTAPSPESPLYTGAIVLDKTTTIKTAAFSDNKRVGDLISSQYVKVLPSSPSVIPARGIVSKPVRVRIEPPFWESRAVIRYTLDGADPEETSPLYTGPFEVTSSTKVKARLFPLGADPSGITTADFLVAPKLPPSPQVYISDLPAVKATTGWIPVPRRNRSLDDHPLVLGGKTYYNGYGVSPYSEFIYDLKPEYKRFVAVVGVDDEMKEHPTASVVFQVFFITADDKRGLKAIAEEPPVFETQTLRANDFWPIDLPIPHNARQIRLVVTDAGDGIDCDHGDWADAGFITE